MGSHLIQRGEIQARLQRGLHLKTASPAPHVADQVVPVIIVEDLSRIDDNIQLADQRPYWGFITQAAGGAGVFSLCLLSNPQQASPAQDKMLVVDRIVGISATTWAIGIRALFGGVTQGFTRDTRYSPLQQSRALLDTQLPAAAPAVQQTFPAAVSIVDGAWSISPGFEIFAISTALNSAITASFIWREFDTIIK